MDFSSDPDRDQIRAAVQKLCAEFGDTYWREVDRKSEYPEKFVHALTKAGWLGALIPTEYGGSGLHVADAAAILQGINRARGNAASAPAPIYTMGTLLQHGSEEQKPQDLPALANRQN